MPFADEVSTKFRRTRFASTSFVNVIACAAVLFGAACKSDDDAAVADAGSDVDASSSSNGGAGTGAGELKNAGLVGDFNVKLIAATPAADGIPEVAAHGLVVGIVKDGLDPQASVWNEVQTEGGCTLLTPVAPAFCDPGCVSGEVCAPSGKCEPNAALQEVGIVSVTGLGDDFTMKPIAKKYQSPTLAYPPCAEGDALKLAADGGEYESFELAGRCVAPFDFEGSLLIEPGKGFVLTWKAAKDPSQSKIHVKVDISHHGGTKGQIECEWPDTGSANITASLLDQLVDLGYAGAPSILVSRVAVGHATTAEPADVTVTVSSSVERQIEIPGLVSCASDDSQCPKGQTCQPDFTCK